MVAGSGLRDYGKAMRLANILGSSLLVGVLVEAACTVTTTPATTDTPTSCGLSLSWKQDATTCQNWMNQNCCAQLQACAGDGACSSVVGCVNACPVPRTDACVGACVANSSPAVLDPISACSKQVPPAVATSIPSQCEWP